jgi:hypothetical protein
MALAHLCAVLRDLQEGVASGGGTYDAQAEQITLFKELEQKMMTFSGRVEPKSGGHYAGMLPPAREIAGSPAAAAAAAA